MFFNEPVLSDPPAFPCVLLLFGVKFLAKWFLLHFHLLHVPRETRPKELLKAIDFPNPPPSPSLWIKSSCVFLCVCLCVCIRELVHHVIQDGCKTQKCLWRLRMRVCCFSKPEHVPLTPLMTKSKWIVLFLEACHTSVFYLFILQSTHSKFKTPHKLLWRNCN